MRIVEATSPEDFDRAADLMREFLEWTRVRFRDMPEVVDAYYDLDAWERELNNLGSHYTGANGSVLLAMDGDDPVGCVALIRFDESICEMKRLYVSDRNHRGGVGRTLCAALLDRGRELGFRRMRLETGDLQVEAQALYRSLGFRDIDPYRYHPQHLIDHMIC
ncbi:MAG: GNAT family N-acetyltransferase, partial [Gammaproteobacteria bacterium]|nr:GNAT family N-acetyltransferase [Gammaproteobacteria bacterium]